MLDPETGKLDPHEPEMEPEMASADYDICTAEFRRKRTLERVYDKDGGRRDLSRPYSDFPCVEKALGLRSRPTVGML